MEYLKKEFGKYVEVLKEDEDMVDILDTDWYKKISSTTTPGEVLKIYRENAGVTQEKSRREEAKKRRREEKAIVSSPGGTFFIDSSCVFAFFAAICPCKSVAHLFSWKFV